ncbi:MAG: MarR family transcriptional regulator [Firmicutes bacterium]|nr:MarR family transcriptional regulator [Bacillota bacterium]
MENHVMEVAEKYLDFHIKMGRWTGKHFRNKFNVNGRGGLKITSSQFLLLMIIGEGEHCTVSELEEVLHTSKSSISITVSRLEKLGYVQKCLPGDEDDGRKVIFRLTEEGEKTRRDGYDCLTEAFGEFYLSLDEKKRMDFIRGIELLAGVFN